MQMRKLFLGLVWVSIFGLPKLGYATHIVGGVFSLQHLSGNSYQLKLKVYRDCLNGEATFDDPATVGVFDKATNALKATYQMDFQSSENQPFIGSDCISNLPTGCTEVGIYTRTISLSPLQFNNTAGYYFSYQRCCRNGIIQNIVQPGEAAIAIYMEIPSPSKLINSTPDFSANVNILFCKEKLTVYNFNFTDADGDELRYSMVTPLNGNLDKGNPRSNTATSGPYPKVLWSGSYNDQQQIIGTPSLGINSSTGEIAVSPLNTGTYVIAIKIEEWRAGVKIGEVILEMQFTVAECPQPPPQLAIKSTSGSVMGNFMQVNVPGSICFDVETTDPIDSLLLEIENVSEDTNISSKPVFEVIQKGFNKVVTRVCWDVPCSVPDGFKLVLKAKATDNGCPKNGITSANIIVQTIPMPDALSTDLLCMTLIDNKETIVYWGDSISNKPSYFSHYFLYRAVDNGPFVRLDSITATNTGNYHDFNTPDYATFNYRYVMRGVNACGDEGPASDTLGTFEQLKFIPDTQQLITVTVADNKYLRLYWPQTYELDFARYFLYKKGSQETNYSLIYETSKISDTAFFDYKVDVQNESYCYYVVMKDTCDNFGNTGYESCSILLKGKAAVFSNSLEWTPYNYWLTGTRAQVVSSWGDYNPEDKNWILVANADSTYSDDDLDPLSGEFSYQIAAYQKKPDQETTMLRYFDAVSLSNEVLLIQPPKLYVPNAFTPNDDGINDLWNVRDVFVKDYNLKLFNKWGQLVFETQSKTQKWDGKMISGLYAPADVYVYTISYSGYDGSEHNQRGNVTVLK